MRLTDFERRTIREAVARHFGPEARVRLFGSRADDSKRGGDIDLYIDGVALPAHEVVRTRIRLLVDLHRDLGEQRIDVVVRRADGPRLAVHDVAESEGVAL